MTEKAKLEENKVSAMVCALHQEIIHAINKDAISDRKSVV